MDRGPWSATATGGRFYFLDPRPEEVSIHDIAAHLANLCRYAGATGRFYSVAEHSVLVASAAPAEHAMEALLHDGVEAYIGDVTRPVRRAIGAAAVEALEDRIHRAVAARFGLPEKLSPIVRELDDRILANERAELFPSYTEGWPNTVPLAGVRLVCYPPERARLVFLDRFFSIDRLRRSRDLLELPA